MRGPKKVPIMLQQLEIRNVAVIADMTVELGEGLNVISGETGSGKSVLIESLKGVFGGRFTKELVRGGADKAVVSALFSVGADTVTAEVVRGLGFEPEGGAVLLSREINQAGKGVCRVNGRVATVGALQAISSSMADIHGQNENHSLSDTGKHIVLLDRFAGDALGLALSEYRMAYASYRAKAAELGRLTAEEEAMRTRAEALRVQVAELSKARLREGEEEELRVRREAARNASEIAASLG
ncbi:MAG: AAA family ATPase, partial [Oscillospiraceae bacterium]|nr:AAA family ATPase [Oscillospiraceae bacterium]